MPKERLEPGSPGVMRRRNSALVLDAIRNGGPVGRTDLARLTRLSKPTVNEIVDLLVRNGFITERPPDDRGAATRPGPRARLFQFRADLAHVIGIDVGADKILALLTDLSGEVLATARSGVTLVDDRNAPDSLLREVAAVARRAIRLSGLPQSSVRAVVVGTPGVIDPVSGRVTLAPQLPRWEGIPLAERLRSELKLDVPVLAQGEVHLSAIAERWLGTAKGIDNAVLIHLGIGIGSAAIINGEVYRGAEGAAGEIGYLPLWVDEAFPSSVGPFEYAAGGAAFSRGARAAVLRGRGGRMLALAGGDISRLDASVVFAAAAEGDRVAAEIVDELVGRIARGIAAVVCVLNPEVVVVGGGISRAGSGLMEPLSRELRKLVPIMPRVVPSSLGENAVAIGATQLAIAMVDGELADRGLEATS
jgi:predicted NBD/HSP70 family sugar kinase